MGVVTKRTAEVEEEKARPNTYRNRHPGLLALPGLGRDL